MDSWNDPLITPDVYRIFSKKLPAKESVEKYISQVKHQLNSDQYCERKSVDVQNRVSSLTEWVVASEGTRAKLDMRVKQPRCLLFYIGGIYEFTYNEDGKFSQSQLCILLMLPS